MFLVRGIAQQATRFTSGVKPPNIYLISDWRMERADVYQQSFYFPSVLISDNLCLVIAQSKPSGNLLLKTPKVFDIQHDSDISIPKPEIYELTDWFFQGVNCSENYVESPIPTKTCKYEKVITPAAQVSENLFIPLDKPDIFGHYFDQVSQKQSTSKDENSQSLGRKQSRDKIPTQLPSQWDLLYPVLLPPLSLEFPQELDFYRELRGYQQQGISWLVDNPSALLADEMGTGKTVQTVNALRLLFRQGKIRSALIVCPPAVIGSVDLSIETGSSEGWSGHFYHWASELEIAVMRGGNREQRKLAWEFPFHVYITTYDTLRTDINNEVLTDYIKFDCIILDEAQKIKNRETLTAKAVLKLQSKYRWALTGTPVQNSLDDIKSLFAFIRPGTFSSGIDYSPEGFKTAIDPYMLRRLKKSVLQELPDKVSKELRLELNSNQKADYERELQAGRESLGIGKNIQYRTHIFPLLTKLKQICNFAKEDIESPKTKLLLEYVETISANNQKVLVFSQYTTEGTNKIAKVLKKNGIKYVLYTGDVSEQQRKQAINDFRSNPDITVFLATIQCAGEGITLTEATYVIHFDHWWNPAMMRQAEDRTHRIGQKSSVTVYSFWMEGTIEDRIKKKLIEKNLLVESTVNELAVEAIENALSTEDWLDIFGIKPAVKRVEIEAKSADQSQSEIYSERKVTSKPNSVKQPDSEPSNTELKKMLNDRLGQLEKTLKRLREQIAGKEDTLTTIAPEERVRIKQQISDLKLEIKPFEEEYWQLLATKSTQVEITETEAEIVVAELVEQVGQLQNNNQYPDEVIQFLKKIYSEVSKPNTSAAAKLKGAISMFPPFVSLGYEVEIDTESFLSKYMPTFTKWCKALAKKS